MSVRTIAVAIRVSEQQLDGIKRDHEQRDEDERELYDADGRRHRAAY